MHLHFSSDDPLLATAAEHLPRWLDSSKHGTLEQIAQQRIWICNGYLHIVPLKAPQGHAPGLAPRELTFDSARQAVLNPAVSTLAPLKVQECIYKEQLSRYPQRAADDMKRVRICAPAWLASVLVAHPELAQAAMRAHADSSSARRRAALANTALWPRDAVGGKDAAEQTSAKGGEGKAAFHMCTVRMRLMHALQLHDRQHAVPKGWHGPVGMQGDAAVRDAVQRGIVVALGLHMHAAEQHVSLQQLLQSPADGAGRSHSAITVKVADLPEWQQYYRKLKATGYFKGNVAGSQAHAALLQQAKEGFEATQACQAALQRERATAAALIGLLTEPCDETAVAASAQLPADSKECAAYPCLRCPCRDGI